MKLAWTVIDGIITAPAWCVGYFVQAYVNAYKHGSESYIKNVRNYRIDVK